MATTETGDLWRLLDQIKRDHSLDQFQHAARLGVTVCRCEMLMRRLERKGLIRSARFGSTIFCDAVKEATR